MINTQNVIDQLKQDEGFRDKPYRCTENKLTIGYGWNIEDTGITEQQAEMILVDQVIKCDKELRDNFKWFPDLPERMQEVLVNMCFNMGISRLKGFKKTLKAFEDKCYLTAAAEMRESKWYNQVGPRAQRLVRIVSGGRMS
jgi:lysozyme